MAEFRQKLETLLQQEVEQPVKQEVLDLVQSIQAKGRVLAILFYGSGLWKSLDDDTLLDFYVLVDDYRDIDRRRTLSFLGRIIPPNVYYLESCVDGKVLRCKYAVIQKDQFVQAAQGKTFTGQIWARFSQPCRLVYTLNKVAKYEVVSALADSVVTFHKRTLPLMNSGDRLFPQKVWERGLAETYAAELRSEDASRPAAIFLSDPQAFVRRTILILPMLKSNDTKRITGWFQKYKVIMKRFVGKCVNVSRLFKATLTFSNGLSYVLWKIERHQSFRFQHRKFLQRHPFLGAWSAMWQWLRHKKV